MNGRESALILIRVVQFRFVVLRRVLVLGFEGEANFLHRREDFGSEWLPFDMNSRCLSWGEENHGEPAAHTQGSSGEKEKCEGRVE